MPGKGVVFDGAQTAGTLLCCDLEGAGKWCLVVQKGADPRIIASSIHGSKAGGVGVLEKGKGNFIGKES